jgi:hypothetical protein
MLATISQVRPSLFSVIAPDNRKLKDVVEALYNDGRSKIGSILKMEGEVEADESFIGGLAKNMHQKRKKHIGTGGAGKTAVLGILKRKNNKSGSKVRAKVIPNVRAETLQPEVRATVEAGARLYTDAWASYRGLSVDYTHEVVDHAVEYVRGSVHTNELKISGAS